MEVATRAAWSPTRVRRSVLGTRLGTLDARQDPYVFRDAMHSRQDAGRSRRLWYTVTTSWGCFDGWTPRTTRHAFPEVPCTCGRVSARGRMGANVTPVG